MARRTHSGSNLLDTGMAMMQKAVSDTFSPEAVMRAYSMAMERERLALDQQRLALQKKQYDEEKSIRDAQLKRERGLAFKANLPYYASSKVPVADLKKNYNLTDVEADAIQTQRDLTAKLEADQRAFLERYPWMRDMATAYTVGGKELGGKFFDAAKPKSFNDEIATSAYQYNLIRSKYGTSRADNWLKATHPFGPDQEAILSIQDPIESVKKGARQSILGIGKSQEEADAIADALATEGTVKGTTASTWGAVNQHWDTAYQQKQLNARAAMAQIGETVRAGANRLYDMAKQVKQAQQFEAKTRQFAGLDAVSFANNKIPGGSTILDNMYPQYVGQKWWGDLKNAAFGESEDPGTAGGPPVFGVPTPTPTPTPIPLWGSQWRRRDYSSDILAK